MNTNAMTHSEADENDSQNSIVCGNPHEDRNNSESLVHTFEHSLILSHPGSPASSAPSSPAADSVFSVSPSRSVFSDFETEPTPETRHLLTYSPISPLPLGSFAVDVFVSFEGNTEWLESDGDGDFEYWLVADNYSYYDSDSESDSESDDELRYWVGPHPNEMADAILDAAAHGMDYTGRPLPESPYW